MIKVIKMDNYWLICITRLYWNSSDEAKQKRTQNGAAPQHYHEPRKYFHWSLQHRPQCHPEIERRRSARCAWRMGCCAALQRKLHVAAAPDSRLVGPKPSFKAQNVRKSERTTYCDSTIRGDEKRTEKGVKK